MQYKNILSAVLLGLAFSGEVAAQGKQGNGFKAAKSSSVATTTATSTSVSAAAAASASSTDTPSATTGKNNGGGGGGGAAALALNPQAVQSGSEQDGTKASGSQAGQVASATDAANFINFCAGKTLTNGLQNKAGSCNGIVMGQIPSQQNMVSTVITNPQNGEDIPPNQTFSFSASAINMVFGAFTNAQATYYSAPQALDPKSGNIIGHLHFTVQSMSAANVKTPLDPKTFAFFKGVNDAGDNKGDLTAVVKGGLDAGTYRVCTLTSAANHQPVLMPVAQRGPQDDCIRFTVGKGTGKGTGKAGGAGGNTGKNVGKGAGVGAGNGTAASSSSSSSATVVASGSATTATGAAATTGTATGGRKGTGQGGGRKGGKGGKGGANNTTSTTTTAAAPSGTVISGNTGNTGNTGNAGRSGNVGKARGGATASTTTTSAATTGTDCAKPAKRAVKVQW